MFPLPRPRWAILALLLLSTGCAGDPSVPELVWGRRGVRDGDFARPRAIAIDSSDRLYVVDFTARVQVYDRDGNYLGPTWTTPDYRKGRPSGLSIDRDGHLLLSDSHYNGFRIYDHQGHELRHFGGEAGTGPGQLGYVSDVVQDASGYFYVAEFGENQRISKFDADGKFLFSWGSPGSEPGQFSRLRALALGPDGLLYAADSCNHRIQVFDRDGNLVRVWGTPGKGPGELAYPYDLAFNKDGVLYVVEYGNHRLQKFTATGESLGCWGGAGREPGRFSSPLGPGHRQSRSGSRPRHRKSPRAADCLLREPAAMPANLLPPAVSSWLALHWCAAALVALVLPAAVLLLFRRGPWAWAVAFVCVGLALVGAGDLLVPTGWAWWVLATAGVVLTALALALILTGAWSSAVLLAGLALLLLGVGGLARNGLVRGWWTGPLPSRKCASSRPGGCCC